MRSNCLFRTLSALAMYLRKIKIIVVARFSSVDLDYIKTSSGSHFFTSKKTFVSPSILCMCFGLFWLPSIARADKLVTDDQIRKAIIGNTISGVESGKNYIEYFHPDGRISGDDPTGRHSGEEKDGNEFYTGHWRISNAELCTLYAEDDGSEGEWDCSPVELKGSKIIWEDGTISAVTRGNVYNFWQ